MIAKYDIITLLKWLFTIGLIINLPITYNDFININFVALPFYDAILPIIYVIVGTTFFTYLLNAYALKNLTASSVSSFIYLQPIVGIVYAVGTKSDTLTLINIFGMLLIFLGIYLVTKKVEIE